MADAQSEAGEREKQKKMKIRQEAETIRLVG